MVRLRYVYGEAKRDPPPPRRNEARPLFLSRRLPRLPPTRLPPLYVSHTPFTLLSTVHTRSHGWDIVPSLILEDRRVVTVVFSRSYFVFEEGSLEKESIFRRTRFSTRIDHVVRISPSSPPPSPHYFYNSKSWKNWLSFTTLLLRNRN